MTIASPQHYPAGSTWIRQPHGIDILSLANATRIRQRVRSIPAGANRSAICDHLRQNIDIHVKPRRIIVNQFRRKLRAIVVLVRVRNFVSIFVTYDHRFVASLAASIFARPPPSCAATSPPSKTAVDASATPAGAFATSKTKNVTLLLLLLVERDLIPLRSNRRLTSAGCPRRHPQRKIQVQLFGVVDGVVARQKILICQYKLQRGFSDWQARLHQHPEIKGCR
mmetsp:Transcript_43447/g.94633  ORF Transcript_43447/g.94633 Transcript_43447/m.94633 type:complete len:224 (-) Transcript_43447:572-1243(-)